jgi:hypothetical protein
MEFREMFFLPDGTGLEPKAHLRALNSMRKLAMDGNFAALKELVAKANDEAVELSRDAANKLWFMFLANADRTLDPNIASLVRFFLSFENGQVVFKDLTAVYRLNTAIYDNISKLTYSEHTALVVAIEQDTLSPKTPGYRLIKDFLTEGKPRRELIEALKEFLS